MSRISRMVSLALTLAGASSALGACQSIAGIEDRHYAASGAGAAGADSEVLPPSQECSDYCEKAKNSCQTDLAGGTVPQGVLYLTPEACLTTCARIELLDGNENGVTCRKQQLVKLSTGEDPLQYCANAAPGGNGACGSNCENYCRLFKSACREQFEKYAPTSDEDDGIAVCETKCKGLTDTGEFVANQVNGNYFGDTLQCRLIHTCSALLDPVHCTHAEFKATDKCLDPPMEKPDCKKFCRFEMLECVDADGNPNIYEDEAQCLDVCTALEPGLNSDQTQNTVGCRMYHTFNSLIDSSHCAHTGPGGDGHCLTDEDHTETGNCESYCGLLKKACESDFDAKFDDQPACQAECMKLDGSVANSGYSISAKGNNVQCRLLNVSRALSNPGKFCAAALGAAPCK